jgi:hypothetical protein
LTTTQQMEIQASHLLKCERVSTLEYKGKSLLSGIEKKPLLYKNHNKIMVYVMCFKKQTERKR